MINVQLYNALVREFGHVKVANEDERAVLTKPVATASSNKLRRMDLGLNPRAYMPQRVFGGEQYHVCCPYCGDRRFRLYISHTWNRDVRTGDKLVHMGKQAICHNENCLSDRSNFEDLDTRITRSMVDWESEPLESAGDALEDDRLRLIARPESFKRFKDPGAEIPAEYLAGRGFDLEELSKDWSAGAADIWIYPKPAAVFLIFQNGALTSWQARYPGEDHDRYGVPKYFWAPGTKKSWLLYNMDRASLRKNVVVVEGVLDAVRVGGNAVAIFGKDTSARQEALLAERWRNGTLLWLPDPEDPESVKAARNRVDKWNAAGIFEGGAKVALVPGSDPGSCSKEEVLGILATSFKG